MAGGGGGTGDSRGGGRVTPGPGGGPAVGPAGRRPRAAAGRRRCHRHRLMRLDAHRARTPPCATARSVRVAVPVRWLRCPCPRAQAAAPLAAPVPAAAGPVSAPVFLSVPVHGGAIVHSTGRKRLPSQTTRTP